MGFSPDLAVHFMVHFVHLIQCTMNCVNSTAVKIPSCAPRLGSTLELRPIGEAAENYAKTLETEDGADFASQDGIPVVPGNIQVYIKRQTILHREPRTKA